MVRKFIIIALALLAAKNCMSIVTEPQINTCYSANKEYKLVISPFFCNEHTCLTHEEIDSLGNNISKEFLSQTLNVFKKMNGEYVKITSYEISNDILYLDVPGFHYFISNDAKFVIIEDRYNISWRVLRLDAGSFQLKTYRGEQMFDLSHNEYARCLNEIYGYSEKIKGLCMIWTNVRNSLKIRIRYFNTIENRYIYKNLKIDMQ
ncbi:MAG: hypothetical protein WC384_05195 [Prolixibacteraceae bacterium]|jgi:hypothetical protein